MKFRRGFALVLAFIVAFSILLTGCKKSTNPDSTGGGKDNSTSVGGIDSNGNNSTDGGVIDSVALWFNDLKEYTGKPYAVINNNEPTFDKSEITTKGYDKYSQLDELGRCGVAMACIGKETMPSDPRESTSTIKPTGWLNNVYPTSIVSGGSLYNKCQLVAFQLTGENAGKQNLITGTKYLSQQGMAPFEDMIANYVKETGNHVMYRVTPIFEGGNLLASGVQLEAYSVEDNGNGICFNVYVYNVQPGITLDYTSGANYLTDPSLGEDDYVDDGGNDDIFDNGGDVGSDVGGNEPEDNNGNAGGDVGGNEPEDNNGNTGGDVGGNEPEDNNGNAGGDVGGNEPEDNNGNTGSDVGGNESEDNNGNTGGNVGGNTPEGDGESTGGNTGSGGNDDTEEGEPDGEEHTYVINTSTKKIHYPDCGSVKNMSEKNKGYYDGSISDLLDQGYTTCGNCKPQ